ncbi:hypothetical protein CHUAL_003149 [Chamberlinius hualienensis]
MYIQDRHYRLIECTGLIVGNCINVKERYLFIDMYEYRSSLFFKKPMWFYDFIVCCDFKGIEEDIAKFLILYRKFIERMAAISNAWRMSRVVEGARKATSHLFNRHLLLTNLTISVSLSATGDVLQQQYDILTKKQATWDKRRTRDMALSGLTVGFICHHWYVWLDRIIPGRTLAIVMKKLVLDQIFLSPVYISAFFVTVGVLERAKPADVAKEIWEKGTKIYTAEWFIWPPAQIINFAFLPTKYRVLYDNIISLGFDVYTSYVKHGDPSEKLKENSQKNEETLVKHGKDSN